MNGQLEFGLGSYFDLQCKMVGRPILQEHLDDLSKQVVRRKRMKAAHDKGRHWKECLYCERSQGLR